MSWRIVPAAATGELAALKELAERVFGRGDRRADWFARKLVREAIDGELSHVAIDGDDPHDTSAWIGFVLAGAPASRWPAVRVAATGVTEPWRRRGVASALLEAVAATARAHGARSIELEAEANAEAFYRLRGFTPELAIATLVAFARGRDTTLPAPAAWDHEPYTTQIHGYLREAWDRTADDARHTWVWPELGVAHHVAREGGAFAVHRTVATHDASPSAIASAFDRLLERLPTAAPVLAVALPQVSSITRALGTAGWVAIQRASIVRRPL